jgi:hypothetical protein
MTTNYVARAGVESSPGRAGSAERRTMSYPLVVHCPNPLRVPSSPWCQVWDKYCTGFLADESLRGSVTGHIELTIVTYNNHGVPGLLERCLAHLGIEDVVVLGQDKASWCFEYKVSLVWDYMQSGACATEYMICLDGDDMLVMGSPESILQRFAQSRCEILFCNTMADWPPSAECWQFEESVANGAHPAYRHLSSGGLIGRSAYIRDRLADIMKGITDLNSSFLATATGEFDDQLAWRQMHRIHHPEIRIDTSASIFARLDTLPTRPNTHSG